MQITLPTRIDTDRRAWMAFRYHSRTFSLATRFLPRSVRMPVAVLYLYCRTVDTIADERVLEVGADAALEELHQVRTCLEETLADEPPRGYLWQRLAHVCRRYELASGPLFELIDGASWDLEGRGIATIDDLVSYSELVGGSVGAMMLPFLLPDRADRAALTKPARALGVGMQITNILRDVGEDLHRLDRVYLPGRLLARYGITRTDLATGTRPPSYDALLEELMRLAESYFEDGLDGVGALPTTVQRSIGAAARMYRDILNEIRKRGYDNLNQRAYVSFARKCVLVLRDDYADRKRRMIEDAEPIVA